MSNTIFPRGIIFTTLLLTNTFIFSQTNSRLPDGNWIIEKFDSEKTVRNAEKVQKELVGIRLQFQGQELVISRKNLTGESIIKRGSYSIDGDIIAIGTDKAAVIVLTEARFVVRIPGQGTLYLKRESL